MRTRLSTSGYTVLELLVVMVVMALLTGLAYVRLAPALGHAKVRSAANVLATDLQYAQMLAVRFARPMVVTVNSGSLEYEIAERGGGTVHRTREMGAASEYMLDELSGSPTSVEFFPNGVAGQSLTVTLGQSGFRRKVTLSRAGKIRVASVP
jgi:type II secretion system protein H